MPEGMNGMPSPNKPSPYKAVGQTGMNGVARAAKNAAEVSGEYRCTALLTPRCHALAILMPHVSRVSGLISKGSVTGQQAYTMVPPVEDKSRQMLRESGQGPEQNPTARPLFSPHRAGDRSAGPTPRADRSAGPTPRAGSQVLFV